jgi:hypothetical protein
MMHGVIANLMTIQKSISPVSFAESYLPITGNEIEGSTEAGVFEIRNSMVKAAKHSVIIAKTDGGLRLSRPIPYLIHISI